MSNTTDSFFSNDSSEEVTLGDYTTPRPSEAFFSNFECLTCLDYFIPPVVQCPNEHYFCLSCVERQALTSLGYKCPVCKKIIDPQKRSRKMEEQLEQLFIPCVWKDKGCKKIVEIARRSIHQNSCKFSDNFTKCYFSDSKFYTKCNWTGTPTELADHLFMRHELKKQEIVDSVSYLWDLPNLDRESIRPRVFSVEYPGKGTIKCLFFLECYYKPGTNFVLFLVRSADSDIQLNYSIIFNDKKNERIFSMFCKKTVSFNGVQLQNYPDCDVSNICYIPYKYLEDIKVDREGQDFFSFTIIFKIDE